MSIDTTKTKKSLGQHWLHDEASLQAMVEAADVKPGDVVLEIGPGTGTLTQKLLDAGAEVWAVEADESLIPGLLKKFTAYDSTQFWIEAGDILKYDFNKVSPNYKVVANIPYYLTSNLLRVMLEHSNPPSTAVLLVQKEVAQRVAAKPGQMSILAVSVQYYCEVSLGREVPAELFTPPPEVDSQILILKRHPQPLFKDVDLRQYFRLVKAGFSGKRKTLRNSLSAGLDIPKPQTEALLTKANINPERRAQTLSLEEWHQLYLAFESPGF